MLLTASMIIIMLSVRVESGSDELHGLSGSLLVDQVGLVRKLNYLNVAWMDFNRSHVL